MYKGTIDPLLLLLVPWSIMSKSMLSCQSIFVASQIINAKEIAKWIAYTQVPQQQWLQVITPVCNIPCAKATICQQSDIAVVSIVVTQKNFKKTCLQPIFMHNIFSQTHQNKYGG